MDTDEEKYDVPLFTIGLSSTHVSLVQAQLERVLGMPRSFFATPPVAAEAEMPMPGVRFSAAASSSQGTENSGQAAASLAALPPAERRLKSEPPPSKELGVSAIGSVFRRHAASGDQGRSEVLLRKKSRPAGNK
mmetsp:Transcript_79602/g.228443  ORF Transcript_79602/g.228443 Transcript_79602/m.228443 type:complete len:134 (+) Transcript_79602:90-491(+)